MGNESPFELRTPGAMSWQVYELADLLRQLESQNDEALRALEAADPAMPGVRFLLKRKRVAELKALMGEMSDVMESLIAQFELLPDRDIRVRHEDAADEARRDLSAGGILEGRRVLLAAKLVPNAEGLQALVDGLRSSKAHRSWTQVTLADLLRAFGLTPHLIRRLATESGLAPGSEFSTCEPDEVGRLASRIEKHVMSSA